MGKSLFVTLATKRDVLVIRLRCLLVILNCLRIPQTEGAKYLELHLEQIGENILQRVTSWSENNLDLQWTNKLDCQLLLSTKQ